MAMAHDPETAPYTEAAMAVKATGPRKYLATRPRDPSPGPRRQR